MGQHLGMWLEDRKHGEACRLAMLGTGTGKRVYTLLHGLSACTVCMQSLFSSLSSVQSNPKLLW